MREVLGHHRRGTAQEPVRRRGHPPHPDRYQPIQAAIVGLDDLVDRVPPTGWWDPVSQRRARDPVAQALPQRVPLGAWNRAAAQRGIVLAVSAFEYHVAAGRPRGHAHRRTPPQHRPGPVRSGPVRSGPVRPEGSLCPRGGLGAVSGRADCQARTSRTTPQRRARPARCSGPPVDQPDPRVERRGPDLMHRRGPAHRDTTASGASMTQQHPIAVAKYGRHNPDRTGVVSGDRHRHVLTRADLAPIGCCAGGPAGPRRDRTPPASRARPDERRRRPVNAPVLSPIGPASALAGRPHVDAYGTWNVATKSPNAV